MSCDPIRSAIVTGASRIGAAIARHLAGAGVAVVVNYAGNEEAAARTVAAITAAGGAAHAFCADVSDGAAFGRMFDEAERNFGPVGMLVNNAGMMAPKLIGDVEDDWFARLFAVNVGGVLNGCRLAAKRLVDGGAIVNLSTSVIGMSPPAYRPYCARKAAVEALTRSLSKELGRRAIRINAIAPGPTDTDLLSEANTAERLDQYSEMTPFGRLGTADEIAAVVGFLATPAAGWIIGQVIRVNGGIVG